MDKRAKLFSIVLLQKMESDLYVGVGGRKVFAMTEYHIYCPFNYYATNDSKSLSITKGAGDLCVCNNIYSFSIKESFVNIQMSGI
jgi:hypothetical protein